MSNVVLYECLVAALLVLGYMTAIRVERRFVVGSTIARSRGQIGQNEVLLTIVVMAAIALIGAMAYKYFASASYVTICEGNEKAIESALQAWEYATGTDYTTVTNVAVTVHSGSTAGTFSNPNSAAIDYLKQQPIDPANKTGSYLLSYTPHTASAPENWTITCPGLHTPSDLASVTNGKNSTKGQIVYSSTGSFTAQ